jgi:hypothetical protein
MPLIEPTRKGEERPTKLWLIKNRVFTRRETDINNGRKKGWRVTTGQKLAEVKPLLRIDSNHTLSY